MQQVIGEFLATFFFMLGANGSIIGTGNNLVAVGLGTAFSTYAITTVFASLGVLTAFNGGITVAHFIFYALIEKSVRRWSTVFLAVGHLLAQYLGAYFSLWALRSFYSSDNVHTVIPQILPGLTRTDAFFSEMVLSAWVYTIFIFSGVVQLRKRPSHLAPLPLNDRAFLFGLLTTTAIYTGGLGTGTYINPTRYLAIATFTLEAPVPGVWVGAPFAGSIVAVILLVFMYLVFLKR